MNYKMQHEEYIHTVPKFIYKWENTTCCKNLESWKTTTLTLMDFIRIVVKLKNWGKKMGGNVNFRGAVRS